MTATIKTTNLQHGSASSANIVLASDGTSDVVGSFQRGHIAGLALSYSNTTTFGIAVGSATASDGTTSMTLSSAYTKTTGSWAVGTGNGALDTGSVTTSTWYHVYLIKRSDTGVVDVLLSTSATAPTMPSNYDLKRRIGAIKTDGSSQIINFTQVEDTFYWAAAVLDINNTAPTADTTTAGTLSVPTGVKLRPLIRGFSVPNLGNGALIIRSPDMPDESPIVSTTGSSPWSAKPGADMDTSGNTSRENHIARFSDLYTNTSAQIYYREKIGNCVQIVTYGWVDSRGRFE